MFEVNGKKREGGEYFSERKHKPKKDVRGKVDRAQWEVIKEFALFQGCPQTAVEDALVQFAADHAYIHAKRVMQTGEFRHWKELKERKQSTRRPSDNTESQ